MINGKKKRVFTIIWLLGFGGFPLFSQPKTDETKQETEIDDPNEIIEEAEESKRKKLIETILESFEFGTADEIKNSLAIFRKLKTPKDVDQIKIHLLKLLESKNPEILKALIFTLKEKKIYEFNDKLIEILNLENNIYVSDILNLFSDAKEKKAEEKLLNLLKTKDLALPDNQSIMLMAALTKIESEKFADFAHQTIKNEYPGLFKERIEAENKNYWQKKEGQKIENQNLENLILSLSELKYTAAGPSLELLLKAAFKEHDHSHELFKDLPDIKIDVYIQNYIIHALGNLEQGSSTSLLKYKLIKYDSLGEDDKKIFFNTRLQLISALSKLKDRTGEIILIESLKDNNSAVRQRSAKLLSTMRSEEAVKILSYRALRDANSKVAFECLQALMETLEPGSTNNGTIIGNLPSSAAQNAARDGILMYLDPLKNPLAHLHWLKYMAETLKNAGIRDSIVEYLQAKLGSFLSKEKQSHTVSILTVIAEKTMKESNSMHSGAGALLQKIAANKEMRYGASMASRSLRYLNKLGQ